MSLQNLLMYFLFVSSDIHEASWIASPLPPAAIIRIVAIILTFVRFPGSVPYSKRMHQYVGFYSIKASCTFLYKVLGIFENQQIVSAVHICSCMEFPIPFLSQFDFPCQ